MVLKVLVIHIIQSLNKLLFNLYTMTFISVQRRTALMMKMLSLRIILFIIIIEYQGLMLRGVLVALPSQFIIVFYKVTHY